MSICADSTNQLAHSFVPKLLVNYINFRVVRGKESLKATTFSFHGVCLIVDISGFTALSEGFCEAGKLGIDGLQVCTNGYIGGLVSIVHAHGGDIIKFAGDALVCVFAEERFSSCSRSHKTKSVELEVLTRAMRCAKEVRELKTDRLTVHVGMSCGEMCFGILGGVENRWECLISGPCIHELSQCLDDAPSMQAVMTAACQKVLAQISAPTAIPSGNCTNPSDHGITFHANVLLETLAIDLQSLPSGNYQLIGIRSSPRAITEKTSHASFLETCESSYQAPDERQRAVANALIRQFVPAPIVEELDSATGLSYFAEIREVVTMFMKWDSYDANGKHRDLLELQPCFYQAQRVLHASGAYLRQFLVDDKGCVLIACWGMPNMSYLDNAHRAITAAAKIRSELRLLQVETSVGITCADVYCGTVGSMERMEYAAIGSEVNMAARIMGKAKGRLLVSQNAVAALTKVQQENCQAIEPFAVKGKAEPLQAYLYALSSIEQSAPLAAPGTSADDVPVGCRAMLLGLLESLQAPAHSTSSRSHENSVLSFGSRAESPRVPSARPNSLRSALMLRSSTHPIKFTVVEGNSGTGKSSVATWLRARAAERSISHLSARVVRPSGRRAPYSTWQKVFHLFMTRSDVRADGQWTHIAGLFGRVFPNWAKLTDQLNISALSEALGLGEVPLSEESLSAQIKNRRKPSAGSRQSMFSHKPSTKTDDDILRDSLVKVFAHLFAQQPTLLIIENIHLAGERSLDLLVHLVPKLSHPSAIVLTALSTTPVSCSGQRATEGGVQGVTEGSAWFSRYRLLIQTRLKPSSVVLHNYSRLEIDAMLCRTLRVCKAPPELLQLVQDFSGGSYFWVREILQFIKEHGAEQFLTAVGAGLGAAAPSDTSGVPPSPLQRGQSSPHLTAPLKRAASITMHHRADSYRMVCTSHQSNLDKLLLVRFGGLALDSQRALRTASIIGTALTYDVLHAVIPAPMQPLLMTCLEALVSQQWLQQDSDAEQLYSFLHPHAQQVIYELTPSSERNVLYAQIAAYVEGKYGTDPAYFAMLSHYFLHCDTDKALQYVAKATEALLNNAASLDEFTEAVDLLKRIVPACRSLADVQVVQKQLRACEKAIFSFPSQSDRLDVYTSCGLVLPKFARFFVCFGSSRVRPIPGNLRDQEREMYREGEVRASLTRRIAAVSAALDAGATVAAK